MKTINTLERLAILVVGAVGIIFIYGMLSMTLAHAQDTPEPGEFAWIDSIFAWPEPTFAQMEWTPWIYDCNNPEVELGCEEDQ